MQKYDNLMIQTAFIWSKASSCERRQVGAVLAKDNRIIAIGYNGTIAGMDNCCEEVCMACHGQGIASYSDEPKPCEHCQGKGIITSDLVLHAEQNVIAFCAKEGIPTKNTTLYITTSPCKQCAKLIAQAGISRVVYSEKYKDTSGINFLEKCEITVEQKDLV